MYRSKMMIVMRRDLKMRKGKIAAQAGHACVEAALRALTKEGRSNDLVMTDEGMMLSAEGNAETPLSEWFNYGCAKICVYVDSEEELLNIEEKAKEPSDQIYYLNDDAREMAQFMFENPEYKVLFDASRKVKKEDIEFVKEFIDRFSNR